METEATLLTDADADADADLGIVSETKISVQDRPKILDSKAEIKKICWNSNFHPICFLI